MGFFFFFFFFYFFFFFFLFLFLFLFFFFFFFFFIFRFFFFLFLFFFFFFFFFFCGDSSCWFLLNSAGLTFFKIFKFSSSIFSSLNGLRVTIFGSTSGSVSSPESKFFSLFSSKISSLFSSKISSLETTVELVIFFRDFKACLNSSRSFLIFSWRSFSSFILRSATLETLTLGILASSPC